MASCRSVATAAIAGMRSMASRSNSVARILSPKPIPTSPFASSTRPVTRTASRVVAALGSVESMMPLHSAIASARLRSSIAVDSTCWSLLSQGHISISKKKAIRELPRFAQSSSCYETWRVFKKEQVGMDLLSTMATKITILAPSNPLSWLDVRVFYVRLCKCEIDESTPDHLTLNHVPLNQDTLLEVNGVRTSIYSDGATALLRRGRVDRKSVEVTYISTDSIRMTGSVKFEVCYKDVLVLSGSLHMSENNGFSGGPESRNNDHFWSMDCESSILHGDPAIEVYVAGSFLGSPIILTKTLHLGQRRKNMRKAMLDSIPEYDASEFRRNGPSLSSTLEMQVVEGNEYKPESEDYNRHYPQYMEGEDEELSWFNAGVRVGVGIGLSVCLGVGIGVGLVVKAYQGTARNFRSRLF